MRSLQPSLLWVAVSVVFACEGKPQGMGEGSGSAESSAGDTEGDSTTSGSTGGTTSTTSTVTTDSPTSEGFIGEPDGGVAGMCDPRAQDCPPGQKCTAVSMTPGDSWDSNTCVEEKGMDEIGEPCDIEDGKYTGIDNCREGTICMLTDDEGKDGICIEFCSLDDECPGTPTASCVSYNDGSLPICLPSCDPLVQDCPDGQACYSSSGDVFVCFKVSVMPGEGGPGDECQYLNQCEEGSYCGSVELVAGCPPGSLGCCTPFCALSEGNAKCNVAMGEDCLPFFDPQTVPPAYADVGVCGIPA